MMSDLDITRYFSFENDFFVLASHSIETMSKFKKTDNCFISFMS